MLQISNLTITHSKDLRVLLENFSLVLNDGDKAVIIGEEGNGKSTLLRWIYDPALVEGWTECTGQRILPGGRIAYLPQELPEEDGEKSVYDFFSEAEDFFDRTPKELSELALSFELQTDFFYSPQSMRTLSGGEKIKAQLMRLLIDSPSLLLLDEPSNDIDLAALELLERLILEFPHIVLFVSHDETLIEKTANVIIHIEQLIRKTQSRYTVARKDYRSYVEERFSAFEKQRQMAVSDKREKRLRDERYQRVLQSVDRALNSASRQNPAAAKNLKDKMHTVKAMGKRFEKENERMTEMPEQEEAIFLKLGDRDSAVPAGKPVLDYELPVLYSADGESVLAENIRLYLQGPEKICIIGKNGAGKTTLLKRIAEELRGRTNLRTEYMPQDYEELLDTDALPMDFLDSTGEKERRTWIRTCLGSMKYTADEMEHPIRELSGGQKAKLFLLKLSLSGANVLILDEPTRNFSPLSGPVIRKLIGDFPGAVISISHDRKYIEEVSDAVYELTPKGLIRRYPPLFSAVSSPDARQHDQEEQRNKRNSGIRPERSDTGRKTE